ncbi:hypothetical protein [Niabella hibiscisoli]|uniref:hypothetical protein n=1 Tax=Niabella hibiscisoli TaxID=1825928 RepID=UPI001F1082DB|nr:hypothetical protein [Niabella hibiscisoli]MCH5720384.1 hypothetical protein [Niabella hibiscisoli]
MSINKIIAQTKKELLNTINRDINGFETLPKVADMHFELTAGAGKDFDPGDVLNFEQQSLAQPAAGREALNNFFNRVSIQSKLLYPYNIIAISKKEFDLLKLPGRDNFYFSNNFCLFVQSFAF